MNPVIKSNKIIIVFLFSVILLILFQGMKIGISSTGEYALEIDTEFEITKYSTTTGNFINTNTIDLELPSSEWNINELELNFTEVEFGQEVKIIEDTPTDNVLIDKFHDGYGVQIVIQDPTILYGVEIYGNNASSENKQIYIQINGNDEISNSPNTTIYGLPSLLNMTYSLTPSWHKQTFSTPIDLVQGTYYLVIDGISIGNSPKSDYYWYFNDVNPTYPELNISELNAGSWSTGDQGTPLLYKLIQKVNGTFFPEDINMTAELDGNFYEILNSDHPGKGYLKKSNINYKPNDENVKIRIKNNRTESLDFNLDYKINIDNNLLVPGKVNIKNNSMNEWQVLPSIERLSNNDSIKFEYPSSWNSISVIKSQQDITSDITIDSLNNLIIIPNDTIESGADWEIKANSLNIDFNLTLVKTDWIGEQELYFSIADPARKGTYFFILRDEEGIQIHQQELHIPVDTNRFTYPIPANIIEGNYIAYVYWHNQTDAGFSSQIFHFTPKEPSTLPSDSPLFLILGISLAGGVVIGGSSYVVVKKVKTNRNLKSKQIIDKCSDAMNLEYIIVLDKKSGIDVYSETYREEKVDATLISGFLQAIQNFGSEVLGRAKDSRTFKVEYRKSIIIMAEFVNLRLIVIMKENPSKNFLYSIEGLAYEIYNKYGSLFDEFQGNLAEFQGIKNLLNEHLGTSFAYPLVVDYSLKTKLPPSEREMVKRALDLMKENSLKFFYTRQLFPENVCTPKDYETILHLIEKKIFLPIDISSD